MFVLFTIDEFRLNSKLSKHSIDWITRLPGITYLRTCNTALTQMYSRKGLRHFCSKVFSSQIDFILVFMYFSIVSAPVHFCISALYKFSMYCIVLCILNWPSQVILGPLFFIVVSITSPVLLFLSCHLLTFSSHSPVFHFGPTVSHSLPIIYSFFFLSLTFSSFLFLVWLRVLAAFCHFSCTC